MGQRVMVMVGLAVIAAACGDSEGSSATQTTGGSSSSAGTSAGGNPPSAGGTAQGGATSGGRATSGGSVSSFGGLGSPATGGKSEATGGKGEATGGKGEATGGKSEASAGSNTSGEAGSDALGSGGSTDPEQCPELPEPSADPDDGGSHDGDLTIVAGLESQLGTYSTIKGDLMIGPSAPPSGAYIEAIDLSHLRVVEGDLYIRNTGLRTIELSRLERVDGQLWISLDLELVELRAPQLESVGALYLDTNIELVRSEFPKLELVSGILYVHRNMKLESWGLDALTSLGSVVITANDALPQCLVDALNANTGAMASSEAAGDPPLCDCPEQCGRITVSCN